MRRLRTLPSVIALLIASGCGTASNTPSAAPSAPVTEATGNVPATAPADPVAGDTPTTASPTTDSPPVTADATRTITVDGVGEVTGPPDFMEVMLGVMVTRPTALAAVNDAGIQATTMIDALRGMGIADSDMQTGDYGIYPEYTSYPGIGGYTVNYHVRVHVQDLDRGGEIIDTAIRAVGDVATVYGVSFGLDDDGAQMSNARRLAVEDARHRAEELAALVGGTISGIVSVEEVSAPDYGGYYGGEGDVPGAPFMPGEVSTSVTVTVTFTLA